MNFIVVSKDADRQDATAAANASVYLRTLEACDWKIMHRNEVLLKGAERSQKKTESFAWT